MRRHNKIMLSMTLVFGAFCLCHIAGAQLLREQVKGNFRPLPGAKTWGKMPEKDVVLPLRYRARVRPAELIVGRNHPNGTRLLALFSRPKVAIGVELPLTFPKGFQGFDEYGDLKPDYSIEVAQYDFSHSGAPEILVAVGNGRTELALNVIQYHAPNSARDAGSPKNWSRIGSFSGQAGAEIQGGIIQISMGSQGQRKTYQWVKGRFVKSKAETADKLR